jgi:hypothetical protein
MYEGGIIVPVLIGCFLIVLTFVIEDCLLYQELLVAAVLMNL